MSNEVREFYGNDVVYRFDKRRHIIFGIVLDTYEMYDTFDSQSLRKGQIRVHWLNTTNDIEYVWRQNQVHLLSRSIVPGDIVRRLEQGKETQRGYCRSVKQYAAVRIIGTNKVIDNVPQERLHIVQPYNLQRPVTLGQHFGRIASSTFKVTLSSRCGSIVEITMHKVHNTVSQLYEATLADIADVYYVGQTLILVPSTLTDAKWLKKTRAMRRNLYIPRRFCVQNVQVTNVIIEVFSPLGYNSQLYAVDNEDLPKLKLLELVDENVTGLSDRHMMVVSSNDTLQLKRDWILKQSAKLRPDNRQKSPKCYTVKKKSLCNGVKFRSTSTLPSSISFKQLHKEECTKENPDVDDSEWTTDEEETDESESTTRRALVGQPVSVMALCTDSKATIIWQDGTEEKDVPTTQLYYSISLDDHEFFPGEWVILANQDLDKYGVIQKVDYLERTAIINWFTCCTTDSAPQFEYTNELSVYDIKKHPVFAFRPGSVVYRTRKCEDNLGTVIDSYPQGFVRVKWMDGSEEDCWPQHIDDLPELHHNNLVVESDASVGSDSSGQVSWETESVESKLGESTTEFTWQNLASQLDFICTRIEFINEAIERKCNLEKASFMVFQILLVIYENSSCLDKIVDNMCFGVRSRHYQLLLAEIKNRANHYYEKTRSQTPRIGGKENTLDVNASPQTSNSSSSITESALEVNDEKSISSLTNTELCIKLITMLKGRMDYAYSHIARHVGDNHGLTSEKFSCHKAVTSTPRRSISTTTEDSFTSITNSPPKLDVTEESMATIEAFLDSIETTCATFSAGSCTINNVPKHFEVLEEAPISHRFFKNKLELVDKQRFYRTVLNETKLLKEALPPGVWVYSFQNRLDLISVMICGPNNTPYENGLFIFDLQLSADYPRSPPHCNYISYNSERLNPNLYVEGRVCVSLLGTWLGRGTEVWGPNSTLLQLIVSIQGLILVAEPYYNEAGYGKQFNSQQGYENSRTYNELVLLRLVQSMCELLENPYEIFKHEIYKHFRDNGSKMIRRLRGWIDGTFEKKPEFPLLPVSKGLKLSLNIALDKFQLMLDKHQGS